VLYFSSNCFGYCIPAFAPSSVIPLSTGLTELVQAGSMPLFPSHIPSDALLDVSILPVPFACRAWQLSLLTNFEFKFLNKQKKTASVV
jgi:hypothetical protein